MKFRVGDKVTCLSGEWEDLVVGEVYTVAGYFSEELELVSLVEVPGKYYSTRRFEGINSINFITREDDNESI